MLTGCGVGTVTVSGSKGSAETAEQADKAMAANAAKRNPKAGDASKDAAVRVVGLMLEQIEVKA